MNEDATKLERTILDDFRRTMISKVKQEFAGVRSIMARSYEGKMPDVVAIELTQMQNECLERIMKKEGPGQVAAWVHKLKRHIQENEDTRNADEG